MSLPAVIMMVAVLALVWGGFGVALGVAMSRERRRERETRTDETAARTGRPRGG